MIADLTPELIELGKQAPWFLVSIALAFVGFKVVRWCGVKFNDLYSILFDKTDGKVIQMFNAQQEFVQSVKLSNDQVRNEIANAVSSIREIEHRLLSLGRTGFQSMNTEYFRILFEESPVPICFVDSNGKFITSNHKTCELLGYSNEELQSLTWVDVTALRDAEADKHQATRVKYGELDYYRIEKTYIRKDGEPVYCALHVYRIPGEGEFDHYITVMLPLKGEFVVR